MVNLQKIDDSSVKFVFTDSDHYLVGNGEIVVPINSLSLVIDESEMVTFKKSATGDPFISFRADNSNLGTKEAIEQFYKENMVGAGGISQEEVQDIVDAATSGMATDTQVQTLEANKFDGATYDSTNHLIKFTANGVQKATIDASAFIKDGMVSTVAIEGDYLVITFNTDAGKDPIRIPLSSIFDPSVLDDYYTKTQIDGFLNNATTMLTTISGDVQTNSANIQDIYDIIDEKEEVIASALTEVRQDVAEIDAKEEVIASALTEVRQDVNTLSGDVNTLSGDVNTLSGDVADKQDALQYYSEDAENKSAQIVIEDNTTTSNTSFDYSQVDLSVVKNVNDILYNGYTNINDGGLSMGYEKITGSDETDAFTHLTVEDDSLFAEVIANEETTTVNITSTGVTINNKRVLTEADGGYLIDLDTIMTRGLTDAEWDGTIEAVTNKRPVYIKTDGYWCVLQSYYLNGNEMTLLAASSNFATINTVTKLGSNQYSLSSANKQFVSQAEKDAWNAKADLSALTSIESSITNVQSAVTAVSNDLNTLSGAVIDNEYTVSQSLNDLNSRKLDISAYTPTDLSQYWTSAQTQSAIDTKQDALSAGTGIEISGNVISAIGGGGATYSAGTNISIDTANTINCTLPISAGTHSSAKGIIIGDSECSSTGMYGLAIGHNADVTGNYSVAIGSNARATGHESFHMGKSGVCSGYENFNFGNTNWTIKDYQIALGGSLRPQNDREVAFGYMNNSTTGSTTFGNANNTLFSVGNGYGYQSTNNYHNAFEIRQNGDIYIPNTDDTTDTSTIAYSTYPMVRLQDTITATASNTTALGGLKLVKIYQADYDALATKDNDTLYLIPDGDSNNSDWEQ